MAYSDTVAPGATTETLGNGVYRTIVAELVAVFPDRVAAAMERLRSDDTIRKQKVGLYCDIYDEQAVIWKTLFPGMDLESIIKDKIPKFVQGIDALKLPSQDIISEVPMNIADYVQLGWIDPALVRNGDTDIPHHQYRSAVTGTGMMILDRLVSIESGGVLTMTALDTRIVV